MLVDDNSPLGHLLRDAEGSAHESWNAKEQRLKDNWLGGSDRVQGVRHAAERLLQRLVERPLERQMDALADLFPGDPSRIGKGTKRGSGDDPPPPPRPRPLQVDSPAGAFVVRKPTGSEKPLAGTVWNVCFAYDTVRGNPIRVFEAGFAAGSPDFSLEADGALEMEADGCEAKVTGANALRFTVRDETFSVRVSGFDERDLKVETREVKATDEEREEDAA